MTVLKKNTSNFYSVIVHALHLMTLCKQNYNVSFILIEKMNYILELLFKKNTSKFYCFIVHT